MTARNATRSVLLISRSDSLAALFSEPGLRGSYAPIATADSVGEARRLMTAQRFDIIVVNTPLADEFGAQAAVDFAADPDTGVLLLVKEAVYEQAAADAEPYGVVTLPKPLSKQMFVYALRMLGAMLSKVRAVERETVGLKARMEEIKLVNQAKWLLVRELKMTEPEAHRYIEKQAMDRCVKRREIALGILRTYGNEGGNNHD